jgi:hypothetical protein
MIMRMLAEEIIKIPDIFDFCINTIYLITLGKTGLDINLLR